ncbi:nucleoside-diphosphate kinase [Pasteurellaceae bacterium RH1A]|nr:nucleoside-diphosphate kinase [Pasteurellaceae bacterium RH1A]
MQQTLAIIKPDATGRHLIGKLLSHMEEAGFTIKALKKLQLNQAQAEGFYAEHQGKAFFQPLVDYMMSGPLVVVVLEKDNAIEDYRTLMGATDPTKRDPNSLRAKYALSYTENSLHGSDSPASAEREIAYFFSPSEII